MFVVVAVFSDDSVRVATTSDVADLLATWRRRFGAEFLPVVAVAAADRLRPPNPMTLQWAAEQFGRLGVEGSCLQPVLEQTRRVGPITASRLANLWSAASLSADLVGWPSAAGLKRCGAHSVAP